jgi:predicted DsbA family dithiol-disulfide isomerase
MPALQLSVTADFICPWCWIGHRHLQSALAAVSLKTPPHIRYLPFELNPDMPVDGVDRKTYRTAKFGSWARSQAMDADVAARGRAVGLAFDYDRVAITPNTRRAHRLMAFAQAFGNAQRTAVLFEAIFAAYFRDGRDIGARDVLADLAVDAGFDGAAVTDFLAGSEGERDVVAAELGAVVAGIRAVPTVAIGDTYISGAQPPRTLADALIAADAALSMT